MSLRMWRKNQPKIDVKDYQGFFDIAYGKDSSEQELDIFLPTDSTKTKHPVIISIHGGGFVACDKRNGEMIQPMLTGLERGYAVVALNYRLAPNTKFPKPVQDIKQAIRFLKANADTYHLDPDLFFVWGGSAGGYMTLMSCVFQDEPLFDNPDDPNLEQNTNIAGAVAWYPLSDFATCDDELKINSYINRFTRSEIVDTSDEYEPALPVLAENAFPFHEAPNSVTELFLGISFDKNHPVMQQASPIHYLQSGTNLPPLFIQHGSADEIVPMQQGIRFAIRAKESSESNQVTLEIIPNAIHSSKLFETKKNIERVLDFIEQVIQQKE
ncbi:alpha/beta hydrolase [Enterococcus cecorum]|uniref:alpha/beta hydrolase n=1 Tax=Enterococcus cecorum TaxID=44008 RepID=UPI003267BEE4